MKDIVLNVESYWTDKKYLPDYRGIYFVYRASNVHANGFGSWNANIEELLYIGKADDQTIFERHQKHEKQPLFDAALLEGEQLWYATIKVDSDIDRVENGLIFKRQPRLNDILKKTFNHPDTHFVLRSSKEIADMFTDFYLKRYVK